MKKFLKIAFTVLVSVSILGGISYLTVRNIQLNKSYEAATQQVTQLQAKLDAVGDFADVYTVKSGVKMGDEILESDLALQTVPVSTIPSNVITDTKSLIGNYFRIDLQPGVTLTKDLINVEEYIGSVYERDVFLDSVPVGTKTGDYLDIRVVLPGGEEFVVLAHKRVNARYENSIKMKLDESGLWLYTSMMVDRALYKDVGLKIYATKYVDPGSHDKTVSYYPVRKEVVDIMGISKNLTDKQRASIWNADLRTSIDAKLSFYNDPFNKNGATISSAWKEEEGRYEKASKYYESLIKDIQNSEESDNSSTDSNSSDLIDPNEKVGSLEDTVSNVSKVDGQQDSSGNTNVVPQQDVLDNKGNDIFADETPIE